MSGSEPPEDFFNRLNAGSDSAGEELYTRYVQRLCEVAARLIGERLKSQYAPEDAAHSALGSFFRGMKEGRYQVDQSGRLWCLLVTIMRHKIQGRGRKARDDHLSADVIDDHRAPEEAVELADAVEAAMTGFEPHHLEICRLFYQEGLSERKIEARVGRSRRTIDRVIKEFETPKSGRSWTGPSKDKRNPGARPAVRIWPSSCRRQATPCASEYSWN